MYRNFWPTSIDIESISIIIIKTFFVVYYKKIISIAMGILITLVQGIQILKKVVQILKMQIKNLAQRVKISIYKEGKIQDK